MPVEQHVEIFDLGDPRNVDPVHLAKLSCRDQHLVGAEHPLRDGRPDQDPVLGRRAEIMAIFPELADRDYRAVPARTLASGRMARKLAVRHRQNARALVN